MNISNIFTSKSLRERILVFHPPPHFFRVKEPNNDKIKVACAGPFKCTVTLEGVGGYMPKRYEGVRGGYVSVT